LLETNSLVAQLAEQRTVNPCVGGSSPPGGAPHLVVRPRKPWKFPGLFAFLGFIVLGSFPRCAGSCTPFRSLTAPENAPDFFDGSEDSESRVAFAKSSDVTIR
jgi:hypothetical protein